MDSAYYDPDQFDNVDGREVIDMHGLAFQVEPMPNPEAKDCAVRAAL